MFWTSSAWKEAIAYSDQYSTCHLQHYPCMLKAVLLCDKRTESMASSSEAWEFFADLLAPPSTAVASSSRPSASSPTSAWKESEADPPPLKKPRHDAAEHKSSTTWATRMRHALREIRETRGTQNRELRVQSLCTGMATHYFGMKDCKVPTKLN
eukprot:1781981-Amphidinium_carterae.1